MHRKIDSKFYQKKETRIKRKKNLGGEPKQNLIKFKRKSVINDDIYDESFVIIIQLPLNY